MHFFPSSGCVDTAIWTLTNRMEKKLNGNYTRMLRAVFNKSLQNSSYTATYHPSWKLSKLNEPDMWDTVGEVRTNSCDILLWTPLHGQAKVGKPARTYINQLCVDTGCSLEDLPGEMDDRDYIIISLQM